MAAGNYSDATNAANSLAGLTKHITGYLDEVVVANARTSDLVANPTLVRATESADTVKVATVTMDGLGSYSRSSGFPSGSCTLTWAPVNLTFDRARQFVLDSVDLSTKDGALTAAYAMSEFVRQKVVPEIDKVRIAKAYAGAVAASQATDSFTASAANTVSAIIDAVDTAREGAETEECVVFVDRAIKQYISGSSEVTKTRDIGAGGNAIYTTVDSIDGAKIVYVPSAYMKSAWTAYDGVTDGQTAGGLVATDSAESIKILAVAKDCAQGVVAHNLARIVTDPDDVDGVKINYRIFHDCVVPTQKKYGICAYTA